MGNIKGTTKCRGHKEANDKFYTKENISKECIDLIDLSSYDIIVEPSAGNGSFSKQIPNCISYDLLPENDNIIQQDFLTLDIEKFIGYKVLTIGNPPFGTQNNMAIKFFNKASEYSDTIAFILPMTFKKESIKNKLNPYFHLEKDVDLPFNSFLLNGKDYGVKCVFQIWKKKSYKRIKKQIDITNNIIKFVNNTDKYDFIVRRVGGNCGKAFITNGDKLSKQSNYFIKNNTILSNEEMVNIINSIDNDVINYSVGPRSISKKELIQMIEKEILAEGARQQKGFEFEKIVSKIFKNITINKKYTDEFDGDLIYNNIITHCQMKHTEKENKNVVELGDLKRNSNKSEKYFLFYGFSGNEESNKLYIHFKNIVKVIDIHLNKTLNKLKHIYVYNIPPNAFNIKYKSIYDYLNIVDNKYTKYMDNIEYVHDKDIFPEKYTIKEISLKTIMNVLVKKDELIHYGFFKKQNNNLKNTNGFISNQPKEGFITYIPVKDNGEVFNDINEIPEYYDAILKIDHTLLTDDNWEIILNIIKDKFKESNNYLNILIKRDHSKQFRVQCSVNKDYIEKYLVKYDDIFKINDKNILSFDEYKEISLWD